MPAFNITVLEACNLRNACKAMGNLTELLRIIIGEFAPAVIGFQDLRLPFVDQGIYSYKAHVGAEQSI